MKLLKVFTSRITIAIVIVLSALQVHSQETKGKKSFWSGWSVNVNAGPNLAYTDIDNYRLWRVTHNNNEWRLGYGLILQKKVHPLIQIRGQVMNGKLSGTKRKYKYWFEADILETSISGTLDLVGLFWGQKVRLVTFYGMAGIGFAHWSNIL